MESVLRINGEDRRVDAPAGTALLTVLRDFLGLTGTKYGCGEGQCGACTVLVAGRAVRSCRTPLESAAGKPITTIEGLERANQLHPVQAAFLEVDALQCGYCTPGMILSSVALLAYHPKPTAAEVRRGLEGNVCRCGVYSRIVEAVLLASRQGNTR